MDTILISGGLGSLGRVLSMTLRQMGFRVVQSGRNVPIGVDYYPMDVANYSQTLAAIAALKPTIVVHLAASFENEFDSAFVTNVLGAKNVLAALKESSVPARVVLAGSAAEYGVVTESENPIGVQRVLHPVSIYGLTKSWQTDWGLFCAHEGQDVVVARIFNLYGAEMSERLFVGRVQQQIREVLLGKQNTVKVGSLSAARDYISLNDASQQIVAITQKGQRGGVYHVASGRPITMRALLKQMLAENGLDDNVVDEQPAPHGSTRYNVPIVFADISETEALMVEVRV